MQSNITRSFHDLAQELRRHVDQSIPLDFEVKMPKQAVLDVRAEMFKDQESSDLPDDASFKYTFGPLNVSLTLIPE